MEIRKRKAQSSRTLGGLVLGGLSLLTLSYFVSCSEEKKSSKKEEKPQLTVPPSVTSSPTSTSPGESSGATSSSPQTLNGKWTFKQFSCTSGALTPWAVLENKLVSAEGYSSPEFQWHTGGRDRGIIRRSHVWTIYGDRAVRESKLAFYSSSSESVAAAAWVSTRKRYAVHRISSGRLVLKHGVTEGPFFQGLPLDPIFKIIDAHIERQVERGGIEGALLAPVRNIQEHLSKQFSNPFTKAVLSFVNELSQASESLNYAFDQTSLTFSQARVNISGFTAEPGIRLVDVSSCGLNGESVRTYERTGDAEPFF